MEELRRAPGAVFSLVPPDILRLEYSGQIEAEAIEALRTVTDELRASHGDYLMLLVDLRNATSMSHAARKKMVEVSRGSPWAASAMVGASFKLRVVAELITKAVGLIMRVEAKSQFFDTEEQAMTWLGERRAALHP